jgi:NitT/TauT family transport system substrate-binding protein
MSALLFSRRSPVYAFVLTSIVLLLVACTAAPPKGAPADKPTAAPAVPPAAQAAGSRDAVVPLVPPVELAVGTLGSLSEAPLYVAVERGYFSQEGLSVELVPYKSGSDMIPALATGELDAGIGASSPALFSALARKIGLRIAADGAIFGPTDSSQALLLRKDLADSQQIQGYADLRQRTIAVLPGVNLGTILADLALQRGGLTLDDAQIVGLGLPDMAAALANQSVDVAIMVEPFVAISVERGLGTRWRSASDLLPNHTSTLWIYSEQMAEQKPEAARRFMVGLMRGARDYNDAIEKRLGSDDVFAVLMQYTPVKDRALYDKMTLVPVRTATGEVDLESLASDLDWYKRHGHVQVEPTISESVDTRFVTYALERLGAYR